MRTNHRRSVSILLRDNGHLLARSCCKDKIQNSRCSRRFLARSYSFSLGRCAIVGSMRTCVSAKFIYVQHLCLLRSNTRGQHTRCRRNHSLLRFGIGHCDERMRKLAKTQRKQWYNHCAPCAWITMINTHHLIKTFLETYVHAEKTSRMFWIVIVRVDKVSGVRGFNFPLLSHRNFPFPFGYIAASKHRSSWRRMRHVTVTFSPLALAPSDAVCDSSPVKRHD